MTKDNLLRYAELHFYLRGSWHRRMSWMLLFEWVGMYE